MSCLTGRAALGEPALLGAKVLGDDLFPTDPWVAAAKATSPPAVAVFPGRC
jgi:hypothetical protein